MIVTIEWMEQWFNKFNHAYFDGKLPLPELKLSNARTKLGTMAWKRATKWGRTKLYDFKISMTTYYDMTERQAQNVLLHEMIHYIIAYTGLKDTGPHGVVFKGMAAALNRKYGWEITAMTHTKGWKVAENVKERKQKKPSLYLVLAMKTRKNEFLLSRVSPSSYYKLENQLKFVSEVTEHQWYVTKEDYFDSYPQVRSLRGIRISRADYERLTNVMQTFEP